MHLLPTMPGTLDQEGSAVDLGQSPADLVILSFTDSDLHVAAAAHADQEPGEPAWPSLRLARLGELRHPLSVDLYVERVVARAKVVLVRLLGGLDYWRYGIDECAAAARRHGVQLAVVPGDDRDDPRLREVSTLPDQDLAVLWRCFQDGGAANVGQALRLLASRAGVAMAWHPPRPWPAAGRFAEGCRPAPSGAPHAVILLYRALLLAADTAPITALAEALAARGLRVTSLFATSLKDEAAMAILATELDALAPDVILNTTAFSARSGRRGAITDRTRAPVLQAMLSTGTREQWQGAARGLGAADLAMNVVLPEVDGRLVAGVLSFKAAVPHSARFDFIPRRHRPEPSRVAHVADLALAWARLRHRPRPERRLACVLSDYPGRQGRAGYAVGLDTPGSVGVIADHLREAGFAIGPLPGAAALMHALTEGPAEAVLPVEAYERLVGALPARLVRDIAAAWGAPAADPAVREGAFAFRIVRAGRFLVAVQPDRGAVADRRADYHDAARPPRHAYVAFYLWLRHGERIEAMIHLGTHGTLEWLPGKPVALDEDCAPEAVLGPVPVVYPFIVNNPGEAAQAKRRIAALTIGHLTPPLVEAGAHGATAELEALFDEYAEAAALDGRRAGRLATAILQRARDTGLAAEAGVPADGAPEAALARLDAWLCDLKEMRIGDGLHVFGRSPAALDGLLPPGGTAGGSRADQEARLARSGPAELRRLVAALDGRFVHPGPAGAPARGRLDVLPTGRNLFTVDPRAVPTRTAYDLGRMIAADVMARYAQDHGDWPRQLVIDLWGSATMRTGGDDLGQAFALIGARPVWDHGSNRVTGYELLPQAQLSFPRVDVTLRISGLFRDTFPEQIALFDAACRAAAALDEPDADNALAASRRATSDGTLGARVFGAAPGVYGLDIGRTLMTDPTTSRETLGQVYLGTTSHAYGQGGEGVAAPGRFAERVAGADAFVHTADLPGSDLLDAGPAADHQGGFAAAAEALGRMPASYAVDTTRPGRVAVRTLPEEIARVVRGRAANPRWIAGQMRHGHRGAAEIAETVDNLFVFAALSDAVQSRHFDLLFDAVCGEPAVRAFLEDSNPAAARAIATRFQAAADRQVWTSRRNAAPAILAAMLGEAREGPPSFAGARP